MKKLLLGVILFLIFGLLYFRAENPRSHFSKYQSLQEPKVEIRNPASLDEKKKTLKTKAVESLEEKQERILDLKKEKNQKLINNIDKTKLENFDNWPDLKLKSGHYKLLKSVGLIEEKYRNQVDPGDILAEKLGYIFVREQEQKDLEALAVVQNQDNKELGILTGIVSIKFKDFHQRDEVLRTLAARVEKEYPHLGISMVRYQDYKSLVKDYDNLLKNSDHRRVNIEILEYAKSGK